MRVVALAVIALVVLGVGCESKPADTTSKPAAADSPGPAPDVTPDAPAVDANAQSKVEPAEGGGLVLEEEFVPEGMNSASARRGADAPEKSSDPT